VGVLDRPFRSESPAVPVPESRTTSTPIGAPPSTATETSRSSSRIGLAARHRPGQDQFFPPGPGRPADMFPGRSRTCPRRAGCRTGPSMAAERSVSSYTARADALLNPRRPSATLVKPVVDLHAPPAGPGWRPGVPRPCFTFPRWCKVRIGPGATPPGLLAPALAAGKRSLFRASGPGRPDDQVARPGSVQAGQRE